MNVMGECSLKESSFTRQFKIQTSKYQIRQLAQSNYVSMKWHCPNIRILYIRNLLFLRRTHKCIYSNSVRKVVRFLKMVQFWLKFPVSFSQKYFGSELPICLLL